jgi:hypothetical protein
MFDMLFDATGAMVKRYHYATHAQLKEHIHAFLMAYNFARRLATLRGPTPYGHISKVWMIQANKSAKSASPHSGTEHLVYRSRKASCR